MPTVPVIFYTNARQTSGDPVDFNNIADPATNYICDVGYWDGTHFTGTNSTPTGVSFTVATAIPISTGNAYADPFPLWPTFTGTITYPDDPAYDGSVFFFRVRTDSLSDPAPISGDVVYQSYSATYESPVILLLDSHGLETDVVDTGIVFNLSSKSRRDTTSQLSVITHGTATAVIDNRSPLIPLTVSADFVSSEFFPPTLTHPASPGAGEGETTTVFSLDIERPLDGDLPVLSTVTPFADRFQFQCIDSNGAKSPWYVVPNFFTGDAIVHAPMFDPVPFITVQTAPDSNGLGDFTPDFTIWPDVLPPGEITTRVELGTKLRFDSAFSYDMDGSIVLFEWNIEVDGEGITSNDPVAYYTPQRYGELTATLFVTDNDTLRSRVPAIIKLQVGTAGSMAPLITGEWLSATDDESGNIVIKRFAGGLSTGEVVATLTTCQHAKIFRAEGFGTVFLGVQQNKPFGDSPDSSRVWQVLFSNDEGVNWLGYENMVWDSTYIATDWEPIKPSGAISLAQKEGHLFTSVSHDMETWEAPVDLGIIPDNAGKFSVKQLTPSGHSTLILSDQKTATWISNDHGATWTLQP